MKECPGSGLRIDNEGNSARVLCPRCNKLVLVTWFGRLKYHERAA